MPEHKAIGSTTIIVENDDFANSYQAGYLRYITDWKEKPLTDLEAYHFIASTILHVSRSNRSNAGYIVGWIAGLLGKHQPRLLTEQMGSVTLPTTEPCSQTASPS